MNKIAFVLPYFGSLPKFFPLFLRSVEKNPRIDLLLITDIDLGDSPLPKNVRVFNLSFKDIQSRVAALLPMPFKLGSPYKLCDCKPIYGLVFEPELKGYGFWGHCDADMIFGDLSQFVTDELLDSHDKLFSHGHLVIYRNDACVNRLAIDYHDAPCGLDFAAASDLCCYFDEVGMTNIAKIAGLRVYENPDFADITPKIDDLTLAPICAQDNIPGQRFFWRNGKIVRTIEREDGQTEFMYIHLQKRFMNVYVDSNDMAWEIRNHGFYPEGSAPAKEPHFLRNRIRQEMGFQLSRIRRFSPERVRLSFAIKALRTSL